MVRNLFVVLFFLSVMSTFPAVVETKIGRYKWELKHEYRSPDCFKKLVITINGTPSFDGTEDVTQCPILPGETFVYRFAVDRPGSYLYHADHGMQREAGLDGSIRISLPSGESEPFAYDYDRSIMLMDWYHKSAYEQAAGYHKSAYEQAAGYHKSAYEQAAGLSSIPFQLVGEPQSIMINGKGRFNCSRLGSPSLNMSEVCNAPSTRCTPYALTVIPGKTYRLRISRLTALAALNFQLEGHNMTVVEPDGHYVEPFVVQNLFIYSGETYSVLIKTDQDPTRNYWATTSVVGRKPSTPSRLAILNYYPNHPRRSPPTIPPPGPVWDHVSLREGQSLAIKARQGISEYHPPPQASDRMTVLLSTQNHFNGVLGLSINNVSFKLPHTPHLIALKHKLLHSFDQAPPPGGHDFWVLGYGHGKFDMYNDPKKFNLVDPIMKNTVPAHPRGWTAFRFRADNPGVWAFHCHIESHFFMGMGWCLKKELNRSVSCLL